MKRVTKLDRKTLKFYARMAAESFVDDPVHSYATKNIERRKKFVYHFLLERLTSSNNCDVFYVDDENRGLCVWRDAHNEYTVIDFLKCPNWVFLCYYIDSTFRTLMAYRYLDSKIFDKKTKIISPVFVDPKHQGKGIAKEMIKKGIEEFTAQGYKIGLEAQNPDNVGFYEKLGFKVIKEEFYKREQIHNYYMVYDPDSKE